MLGGTSKFSPAPHVGPHRRFTIGRTAAIFLALTAIVAGGANCSGVGPIPAEVAYQQVDSPEAAYAYMKNAVTYDQKDVFYYLLASDVRKDYQYWMIEQGWSEIKKRVGIDVEKSKLLDVTYLDESPVPPHIAARLAIEYPHPSGEGTVVENFLCVLELDTKNYFENFPQWRVYYPYDPYQTRATWFRDLREQEQKPTDNSAEPDTENGPENGATDGTDGAR